MRATSRILGEMTDHRALQDSCSAYFHAKDKIKGPWKKGESVIARSANYSYLYATYILKHRFPEGEPVIATCANSAYSYASDIIGGRWTPGEEAILKHPFYAFAYAKYVMQSRWLEAEPTIAASMNSHAYLDTFPEAREDWASNGWIDWLDT